MLREVFNWNRIQMVSGFKSEYSGKGLAGGPRRTVLSLSQKSG